MKSYSCYTLTLCFILVLLAVNQPLKAQATARDTLWLLSGKRLIINDYQFNDKHQALLFQTEKGRDRYSYYEDLFSLQPHDSTEHVFYTLDSASQENNFTVSQMRSYVSGAYDARQYYKPRFAFFSGMTVGALAPFVHVKLAPLLPLAYGVAIGQMMPHSTRFRSEEFSVHDTYYMQGYVQVVGEKNTIHALLGGATGLALSYAAAILIANY